MDYSSLKQMATKKWTGLCYRANIPVNNPDTFLDSYYQSASRSLTIDFSSENLTKLADSEPRKAIYQLQYFAIQELFKIHPFRVAMNQEFTIEFRALLSEYSKYELPAPILA